MQDFNYLATNCFEITLELGCEKYPPAEKLPQFWKDNEKALYNYIWQVSNLIPTKVKRKKCLLDILITKWNVLQVHSGIKGVVSDQYGDPIEHAIISVTNLTSKYPTKINHDILSGMLFPYNPFAVYGWSFLRKNSNIASSSTITHVLRGPRPFRNSKESAGWTKYKVQTIPKKGSSNFRPTLSGTTMAKALR